MTSTADRVREAYQYFDARFLKVEGAPSGARPRWSNRDLEEIQCLLWRRGSDEQVALGRIEGRCANVGTMLQGTALDEIQKIARRALWLP